MTMPYSLQGAAPEHLPYCWHEVAPLLAGALSRGSRGITLEDVLDALQTQRAALWLVVRDRALVAAVVVHVDAQARALCVWLMGGERMDEWIELLIDGLSRHARELGLDALQAEVRPGLVRKLRTRGWQPQYTTVRKKLWADS